MGQAYSAKRHLIWFWSEWSVEEVRDLIYTLRRSRNARMSLSREEFMYHFCRRSSAKAVAVFDDVLDYSSNGRVDVFQVLTLLILFADLYDQGPLANNNNLSSDDNDHGEDESIDHSTTEEDDPSIDLAAEVVWLARIELLFDLYDLNKTETLSLPQDLLFFITVVQKTLSNLIGDEESTHLRIENLKREIAIRERKEMDLELWKDFLTENDLALALRDFLELNAFRQDEFLLPPIVAKRYRTHQYRHAEQIKYLEDVKARFIVVTQMLDRNNPNWFLKGQVEGILKRLDKRIVMCTLECEELVNILSEAARDETKPTLHTKILKELSLMQSQIDADFQQVDVILYELAKKHFDMSTYPTLDDGRPNLLPARGIHIQEDSEIEDIGNERIGAEGNHFTENLLAEYAADEKTAEITHIKNVLDEEVIKRGIK